MRAQGWAVQSRDDIPRRHARANFTFSTLALLLVLHSLRVAGSGRSGACLSRVGFWHLYA